MNEQSEDMMIALYLTGEGEKGFGDAHMKECLRIVELIKRVRKEMKKERG